MSCDVDMSIMVTTKVQSLELRFYCFFSCVAHTNVTLVLCIVLPLPPLPLLLLLLLLSCFVLFHVSVFLFSPFVCAFFGVFFLLAVAHVDVDLSFRIFMCLYHRLAFLFVIHLFRRVVVVSCSCCCCCCCCLISFFFAARCGVTLAGIYSLPFTSQMALTCFVAWFALKTNSKSRKWCFFCSSFV